MRKTKRKTTLMRRSRTIQTMMTKKLTNKPKLSKNRTLRLKRKTSTWRSSNVIKMRKRTHLSVSNKNLQLIRRLMKHMIMRNMKITRRAKNLRKVHVKRLALREL